MPHVAQLQIRTVKKARRYNMIIRTRDLLAGVWPSWVVSSRQLRFMVGLRGDFSQLCSRPSPSPCSLGMACVVEGLIGDPANVVLLSRLYRDDAILGRSHQE